MSKVVNATSMTCALPVGFMGVPRQGKQASQAGQALRALRALHSWGKAKARAALLTLTK
jgi:hypothetical protein